MPRRKPSPQAEVVRTYAELEQYVSAFFGGHYNLLIILGAPGLCKSQEFEGRLGPTSRRIHGWTAPLQAYIDCYQNRNKLLVFDDAETLWSKPAGRVLLRSLCESRTRKTLQWASTTRELVKAGAPQRFETSSKVAIIANVVQFGTEAEFEAIMDRGHVVLFDPTPMEVHRQAARWYWDQDIFDFIAERLHLIRRISSRLYVRAWERKKAGGDWKAYIGGHLLGQRDRTIQELEVAPTCPTVDDKVRRFIEKTGACRATYFNRKRRLERNGQLRAVAKDEIPRLQVRGQPPEELSIEDEVARAEQEDKFRGELAGMPITGPMSGNEPDDDDAIGSPFAESLKDPGTPTKSPPATDPPDDAPLPWLKQELRKAIKAEDYARAAKLRDLIQKMQQNEGDAPEG